MQMDSAWSLVFGSLLLVLLLSQVLLWAVLVQVVKQQGRVLLRLDDLGHGHGANELPVLNGNAAAHAQPQGPAVGDPVAPFALPDLAGHEVTLQEFLDRDQRVLLVNWSPSCGFCEMIAPDLAEHQARLLSSGVQLILVSSGDAVKNLQLAQEHGLNCPILLQPDSGRLDIFRNQGTPVALVVDQESKVATPLSVGAYAVPELIRSLVAESAAAESSNKKGKTRLRGEKPLSESRIIRDGLKAGTAAPSFTLPDIHGDNVALEDFRGQPVVLVLSDPHCGPCDALAPRLASISEAARGSGVQLLMVSRGEIAESRAKAEQHRLDFPVLVQQRWEISKAFGIFATPVAFLIGEDGVIQRDVAQGGEAILALINDQLEARKEHRSGLAIR